MSGNRQVETPPSETLRISIDLLTKDQSSFDYGDVVTPEMLAKISEYAAYVVLNHAQEKVAFEERGVLAHTHPTDGTTCPMCDYHKDETASNRYGK
jgi:pyruvate/2-oxoglutarate dehydrogenase complex dihydrolipoamide dehydrogenase (E3) component